MIITKKHLSRRTILRGIGASLALPLLDGMLPAFMPRGFAAAAPVKRFGAIYVGMGMNMNTWMQPAEGALQINPILQPFEGLRDRVEAARERLTAANADNRRLYEALEPVVGSYCPGLARTPYHDHRYGARPE